MTDNEPVNEEEQAMDDSFLDGEEGIGGENIFQTDEAAEGMKRQAEALGIDPEQMDLRKEQKVLYARKNCKHCYGRGVMVFVPSPAKPKKIKVNLERQIEKRVRESRVIKVKARKGRRRQMRRKPTQKRVRIQAELPGNALDEVWNTCKPEPVGVKKELRQHLPCRCVKTLEI